MSDSLRPLLDRDDALHVSDVLRAGLEDDPSAESFARAARQLGLGSAVALSATTVTAGASKITATGAGSGLAAIAKWFAMGALMGGVVSAPLVFHSAPPVGVERTGDVVSKPAVTERAGSINTVTRPAAPPPAAEPEPSRRASPSRSLDPAPRAAAPTLAPSSSVASFGGVARSSLEGEVATLDAARRALEGGNANSALATLDRYERDPSPHALGAEAQLLRVRALMATGRGAEAQRIAKTVLQARGNDGYACRLAKLASVAADGCPEAPR